METAKEKINSAVAKGAETSEYVKAYLSSQVDLKKRQAADKSSQALTGIIQGVVLAVLGAVVGLFGLVALALFIAQKTELSIAGGFLMVALLFLVLALIFLAVKKALVQKPIEEKIEDAIFKGEEPELTEAELKLKVERLKIIIENSAKEVPEKMKNIEAEDFLPENIRRNKNKVVNTASKVVSKTKKAPMYLKVATAFVNGFIDELRSDDEDTNLATKPSNNTQPVKENIVVVEEIITREVK